MIAKRRYKVRVLTKPIHSIPTTTAPIPTVAMVSAQTLIVRSTAESILVTIHKLATGQFAEVPHQTNRSLNDNRVPLGPMQDWHQRIYLRPGRTALFPLLQSPLPPHHHNRRTAQDCSNPLHHGNAQQATEKCSWGLHCPICKNEEEHGEED